MSLGRNYFLTDLELQKRVFAPVDDGVRKVVVATNIAATSLTIEGIRQVLLAKYRTVSVL